MSMNIQALLTPTEPLPESPLYQYLKAKSKTLYARLEVLGDEYEAANKKHGMGSLMEKAKFAQFDNVLQEYMRVEDVLAGRRAPSYEDISLADKAPEPKSARNLQRGQRKN